MALAPTKVRERPPNIAKPARRGGRKQEDSAIERDGSDAPTRALSLHDPVRHNTRRAGAALDIGARLESLRRE